MKYIIALLVAVSFLFFSCQTPYQKEYKSPGYVEKDIEDIQITPSQSVSLPKDGAAPIAGVRQKENADRIITFTEVGEKIELKNGQTANFVYDGISPEETYIIYEQTLDGYTLELAYRNQRVNLPFSRLCQLYIVASPTLTTVEIPENMKYEQVIWTPRSDGTWEVRVGTTERGCKSQALDELQKLRTKDYDSKLPRK